MKDTNGMAVHAAHDDLFLAEFASQYSGFILKCASRFSGKHITKSDDEWSVALEAFCESVKAYSPDKGDFIPFSSNVINRRLTDLARSRKRFFNELPVNPESFSGENVEKDPLSRELAEKTSYMPDQNIGFEIESLNGILRDYGFTFLDLVSCSPKSKKTKAACRTAVKFLSNSAEYLPEMRQTRMLPIKILEKDTGLPRKLCERHRKYIIAATEIISGDFPFLAEYLKYIREDP